MAIVQDFAHMLAGAMVIGVFASLLTGVQCSNGGVCYGMIADDLPSPSEVVQLYRSNGIGNMRVYFPNAEVMEALRGTGIGLVLGVANEDIGSLAACPSCAATWVQTNVRPYYPAVNILYVAVGNEVADGAAQSILPAMRNLQGALAAAGLAGVKVSTCVRYDAVASSFPPSSGVFAQPYMADIARFLATTGAPLLANVYPYFAYSGDPGDISLNYALFLPGTTVRDSGNGLLYTNLFDAMVDAVHAALEKAGAPDVRVVVSESGWPSAGGTAASVQNAQTYNQNLINHAGQGTPRRPGAPVETYVFAMFNENKKPGEPTERNFGLFYPNKSPSIGVCYGMFGNNLPPASDVVQLYKSHGITNMRIYNPDPRVLAALRGSGIGLILGVANEDLAGLAASEPRAASWVQANVKPYHPAVNIMYLSVGNEVSGEAAQSILPAMRNLESALAAAGLGGGIKVSTAVRLDVVANSFPPSSGVFAPPHMAPIAQFLARTGAPLLANVYPYFAYRFSPPGDISLGYALFQPGTAVRDSGNGLVYTNLFDAMVDSVHAALEKAGAAGVRVVASESGWPSAGGAAASVQNARTYNQNLIRHVGGRQGTPKRPGAPLETYVFALFNENQKPGEPTETNFGLLYPNKSPVYPITFR
ncbi:hypothetical protein U9M48_016528 [Paspalum notatum var. saurae]|uniref:Beta-1,3-glucanase n=1 Tax=Paspalum notatum var. saurae TaxID=547442 RepID=A0AAQ3T5L6_PASNO